MKHSLHASSIIEALIVLLIVTMGIVGVFSILRSSLQLSESTSNRIEAIQIARDGLEAMTSIRDTNWLLFAADYENCWDTLNYDSRCFTDPANSAFITPGSYTLSKNPSTNQFELTPQSTYGSFPDTNYRVARDSLWFYTQSGGTNILPIYTRDIQVSYPAADTMQIIASIRWKDSVTSEPRKLDVPLSLTNWKKYE